MSRYRCKAILKPGDKVRIRPIEYFEKNFKKDENGWYKTMCGMGDCMLTYCGKVYTIKFVYDYGPQAVRLVEDNCGFVFGPDTFTKVSKKEEVTK